MSVIRDDRSSVYNTLIGCYDVNDKRRKGWYANVCSWLKKNLLWLLWEKWTVQSNSGQLTSKDEAKKCSLLKVQSSLDIKNILDGILEAKLTLALFRTIFFFLRLSINRNSPSRSKRRGKPEKRSRSRPVDKRCLAQNDERTSEVKRTMSEQANGN